MLNLRFLASEISEIGFNELILHTCARNEHAAAYGPTCFKYVQYPSQSSPDIHEDQRVAHSYRAADLFKILSIWENRDRFLCTAKGKFVSAEAATKGAIPGILTTSKSGKYRRSTLRRRA